MSISVLACRSRQHAVLAATSLAAAVAIIGFFESNMVELAPVAAAQPTMEAHVTAENIGTARVSGSAAGEPVSYRLTDEQDDQTDQADEDWAQQQEEEQQDWDQLQNQINAQQQLTQQWIQQSEQQAQQQNDAAAQQALQDEQQAQMDEQQANQ